MNQELHYAVFRTPAGWMGLLGSPAGLRRIILPQTTDIKVISSLYEYIREAKPSTNLFRELINRFLDYFSGRQPSFPDVLDFSGHTPFQCKVWEATQKIPYGKTHTYAWVAEQSGNPKAVRAVGQALSLNPFPIIVPCHRVTSTGGGLGGFTGGLKVKKYLLNLEQNRHVNKRRK